MTVSALQRIRDDVLAALDSDWVSEQEVYTLVSDALDGRVGDLVRDFAFGVVSGMVFDGLVVVGDISAGGFAPWVGSTADVLERAYRQWSVFPRFGFGSGDAFWLNRTSE